MSDTATKVAPPEVASESESEVPAPIRFIFRYMTYPLLVLPALAAASEWLNWGWDNWRLFIFFGLGIIPLAGITSAFAEELATHWIHGPKWLPKFTGLKGKKLHVGAAFGAIFDNLAFIIMGFFALQKGLVAVIQASIAGAIISNTLFVLGLSFFFGTMLGRKPQIFNGEKAKDYAKLLAVIVTAFVLLAFVEAQDTTKKNIGSEMSVGIAIALIALFFIYVGHEYLHLNRFEEAIRARFRKWVWHEDKLPEYEEPLARGINKLLLSNDTGYHLTAEDPQTDGSLAAGVNSALSKAESAYKLERLTERKEREPGRPWPLALLGFAAFAAITILVGNEWADMAQRVGASLFSQSFLGLIAIPFIGSAAEHLTSILSAIEGKTEDAVNNTAGSAIQITLIAAPVLVLVSQWWLGVPFSFDFSPIELAVFGAATFIFYAVTEDGEGTWLEGAALIIVYVIFAFMTTQLP